tara:strand:+ start:1112 stop:1306 length:195 start_codon:yes stop_codon:yes gene_type:complete
MVACVTREKQDLLDALCAVRQEIKAYPTPIAGCDDQFNALLLRRDRLMRQLYALVETDQDPEQF